MKICYSEARSCKKLYFTLLQERITKMLTGELRTDMYFEISPKIANVRYFNNPC